jgi:uncharacterized membrane protein YtjA (UPF0391 family)
MLRWALIFFVVALIAAVFGFFPLAVAAAGIAKILFFIFLVLFLVSCGRAASASLVHRIGQSSPYSLVHD